MEQQETKVPEEVLDLLALQEKLAFPDQLVHPEKMAPREKGAAVASKETEEMRAKMLQEDLMVKTELLELLAQLDLKEMSDE